MSTTKRETALSNSSSICLLVSLLLVKSPWILADTSIVPLVVPAAQGGGVFGGYWVTMHIQQVADSISWMRWGVYRCVSGNPFGMLYALSTKKAVC